MEERSVKYLVSNEQDARWGVAVTTVGHQDIASRAGYPSPDHPSGYLFSTSAGRVLDEYQIVYISRGRGRFASAHVRECAIDAGDMFLLFPGEWHTYSPDPETGWHESWIGFRGEDMERRMASRFFSPERVVFGVGVSDRIYDLFRWGVAVAQRQEAGHQQILAGIVNLLLGVAYSCGRHRPFRDRHVDIVVSRAKIIMQENLGRNLRTGGEAIARELGVGYSWFRHVFKEYTGFSPNGYMLELRISRAKELLADTDLSCQQIAYAAGFETPSYFAVAFRKRVGATPLEYRSLTRGRLPSRRPSL